MPMSDEEAVVEQAAIAGIGTKVFGKWDATEVVCNDPGIAPYVNLTTIGAPTAAAGMRVYFGKAKLSIIERFINSLMRTGKYAGKKQHCAKAFEAALDSMAERKGRTPPALHRRSRQLRAVRGDHQDQVRRRQPAEGRRLLTKQEARHRTEEPRQGLRSGDGQEHQDTHPGHHLRAQQGIGRGHSLLRRLEARGDRAHRGIGQMTVTPTIPGIAEVGFMNHSPVARTVGGLLNGT